MKRSGRSAAEIIRAKGGPAAFASVLGQNPVTVRTWKKRQRFPRGAWPEILRAYPDISLDDLFRTECDALPTNLDRQGCSP